MKMSHVFPKVFQVNGNPSFDVQDCKYIAYGEGFRTTAQEDSAIAEAVLNHDTLTETNRLLNLECEELRKDMAFLWKALDNISTAGDVFKPEINDYFNYVNAQCEERSKVAFSDGYSLFYTSDSKELLDK